MNPSQLSIALLAVLILVISIWWISRTLKEGRKAVEDMKRKQLNYHSACYAVHLSVYPTN